MKILKFLAFDGKSMRYDVTGFEHGKENEMSGVFLDGNYYEITETIDDENENFHPVAVVMQFTGLHDKNGKEIYEGDIVNGIFTTPNAVLWGDCDVAIQGSVDDVPMRTFHGRGIPLCTDVDYEIIGNIHQNPELLES